MNRVYILLVACCMFASLRAQESLTLTLDHTIKMAKDSSLEAFRSKNMYLAGYWGYRSFRANRLPSLSLNLMPAQYYRDITKRYNSDQNIDVFREQQSFSAGGALVVAQNLDVTGGNFFLESGLNYMRNLGEENLTQFSSIPIRVGYRQDLVGYNPFKWERAIEPIKFELAKRQLLYSTEQIAENATEQFFNLALAQTEYDMAKENALSNDSLYQIGQKRFEIASISNADLLTLKLDVVNSRNSLQNATSSLKRASFSLASFLNIDKNAQLRVILPTRTKELTIAIDEAMAMVRQNNPDIKKYEQQILEARKEVAKSHKESIMDASFNASIGFNQVSPTLAGAYRDPLQQDLVQISMSIPLVDWGVRKGKYNMAKNNLNVAEITVQQSEQALEKEVIVTVEDFMVQQQQIATAEEAHDLAVMAYNETKQRFMIGKADVNSITLSLNRQQEAQRNYIKALKDYWMSYYKLRKLTLHDFELGFSLSEAFEFSIK